MSNCRLKCELLWTLCRAHGWGQFVSSSRLVRDALERSQRGRGRRLLEELLREPYVEYYPDCGFRIKNDPDSQALAAVRLLETCGTGALRVEATLSRFDQTGGFDAYDTDSLAADLVPW